MKIWLGLMIGWLILLWSTLAGADPLTFTTMQVQATTLHPTSQEFALTTDFNASAAEDVWITVTDPLRSWTYAIPATTDRVVMGLESPRVYRPTTFSAEVVLRNSEGVLDQRKVEWTTTTPVPEPATVGLLAWGLGIIVWTRRRLA